LKQRIQTVGGILVDTEMRSESQISQLEEHLIPIIEVVDDSSEDEEEPNVIDLGNVGEDDEEDSDSGDDEIDG
jgi:hypothetical protein